MRLIDADKIIDSLGNSDMDFAIGAVIDEQPTAFNVDKVVKQLKPDWCPLKPLPEKKEYVDPTSSAKAKKILLQLVGTLALI